MLFLLMYLLSSEGDKEKSNKHFSGSCFSRVHVLVGVNVRTSVCGGWMWYRDISSTSVCVCSCVNAYVCGISVCMSLSVFARV